MITSVESVVSTREPPAVRPGIHLTPTERRILSLLTAQPGRPWRRSELVERVMNGAVVLDRTIDVHIRALRVKLGREGARIQTVRGVGYRWYAESLEDPAAERG